MRALVVANPAATTTNRAVGDRVLATLRAGLHVEIAETTHRGHGSELARKACAARIAEVEQRVRRH